MQRVEAGLLPTAMRALYETGLPLKGYPVEGYYGKSPELTQYFSHIRTLQMNFSGRFGDAVRRLHGFYTNEVFGLGQAVATAINPEGAWFPDEPPAVISPMVDPLTVAVSKAGNNPATAYDDLTVGNIANVLEGVEYGKGLVGFGSLVDKTDRAETGEFNPVATTLARETTVLSAHVVTLRGMPQYKVSPEIEERGNGVVDAYNALFGEFGFDVRIPNITRRNAFGLEQDITEPYRCVRIFNLALPGTEPEYYHWGVILDGYRPRVIDFWRKSVITTDAFLRAPQNYTAKRRA